MKIAYISNSIIPSQKANSVQVMKMCNSFKKNKVDVSLFCGDGSKTETKTEIFSKYAIDHPFELENISQSRMWQRIFPQPIYLAIITYLKLSSQYNKRNIDFLFGRSIYGLYLLKSNYTFIYESHMPPRKGLLMFLEKQLLKNKNCKALIVISEALKNKYMELFPWFDSSKIIVMHDAADEVLQKDTLTLPKKPLKVDDTKEEVIIGYLGHLYFGKGMEIIIELAKVRKKYTFHIVGGTDEWVDYWKGKTRNLHNIEFYGYVDNSKIDYYYNNFDICLLPFSRNIFYDEKKKDDIGSWISPLKLFEAMSFEKAIIASNLPTIAEVLTNELDSFLVDPNDIDEWVRKLDLLVHNKIIREKLGREALNKFKENYTWDIRAERIINILKGETNNV